MAAPGSFNNPRNPFRAVGGQTFVGGPTSAILGLQGGMPMASPAMRPMMPRPAGGNVSVHMGFGNGTGGTGFSVSMPPPAPFLGGGHGGGGGGGFSGSMGSHFNEKWDPNGGENGNGGWVPVKVDATPGDAPSPNANPNMGMLNNNLFPMGQSFEQREANAAPGAFGAPNSPLTRGFASGGTTDPGETVVVGENGPEIARGNPDGSVSVLPHDLLRQAGGVLEVRPGSPYLGKGPNFSTGFDVYDKPPPAPSNVAFSGVLPDDAPPPPPPAPANRSADGPSISGGSGAIGTARFNEANSMQRMSLGPPTRYATDTQEARRSVHENFGQTLADGASSAENLPPGAMTAAAMAQSSGSAPPPAPGFTGSTGGIFDVAAQSLHNAVMSSGASSPPPAPANNAGPDFFEPSATNGASTMRSDAFSEIRNPPQPGAVVNPNVPPPAPRMGQIPAPGDPNFRPNPVVERFNLGRNQQREDTAIRRFNRAHPLAGPTADLQREAKRMEMNREADKFNIEQAQKHLETVRKTAHNIAQEQHWDDTIKGRNAVETAKLQETARKEHEKKVSEAQDLSDALGNVQTRLGMISKADPKHDEKLSILNHIMQQKTAKGVAAGVKYFDETFPREPEEKTFGGHSGVMDARGGFHWTPNPPAASTKGKTAKSYYE